MPWRNRMSIRADADRSRARFRPPAPRFGLPRNVRRFLAGTRAAAGITSALVTVMFLAATALIVDHVWLVGQRDTTKNAVDAATIAATQQMESLTGEMSEEDRTRVAAVARRYALLNILGNTPSSNADQARRTLQVDVPESAGGKVDLTVRADLGGTLLSRGLLGYAGPGSIEQRASVQPSIAPTELVFAFDMSLSMRKDLAGRSLRVGDKNSRMEIVKQAALDLLDVLEAAGTGSNAPFAVGLVPWHHHVRLGAAARAAWEANGWAAYAAQRDYPHPPSGKGPASPAHPVTQTLPAKSALPTTCGAWAGCLDLRTDRLALPSASPFVMRFFSPEPGIYPPYSHYISFKCQTYTGSQAYTNGWWYARCYDWSGLETQTDSFKCGGGYSSTMSGAPLKILPQEYCTDQPAVLPLTTDVQAVRTAIGAFAPLRNSATNSALGVTWAHRLLAPAWRTVWGGAHPMASTEEQNLKKVLVLLTDGEDNHPNPSGPATDASRGAACTAIKGAGVRVFTISAMNTSASRHAHLAAQLRACSSQADDPDGTYAFVNNATPQNLAEAFREIGRQLLVMRRVY